VTVLFGSHHDGPLAAAYGSNNQKRLSPRRDRVGQWGVRQLMGQILLAGEEPQERSALLRDLVADRPLQHGIAGLERVEDRDDQPIGFAPATTAQGVPPHFRGR